MGNEVHLLRAGSDRMRAPQKHVPANLDPRERHCTIGVGRVDDLELKSIRWQILESALEVERLERAICVLARARPHLGSDALPLSQHRLSDFHYVCFPDACPWLIVAGLRAGSAQSSYHQKEQ